MGSDRSELRMLIVEFASLIVFLGAGPSGL
jgi:hypothetical protein